MMMMMTTMMALLAAGAAPPPNIIVILLDNVGQEWFGAYGSEERATPNIDALAAGGLRFEHVYTPPVCGPSRAVLLTGRYPFRTGWTLHHDAALYGGGGLDPRREVLFPRVLRQAGYATGIAGKWQVNNLYDEPGILRRHGFDEHLVWPGSVDRTVVRGRGYQQFRAAVRARSAERTLPALQEIEHRYWDPVLIRNGRRETHPGRFGPDVLQTFALDFIGRHRKKPFLLYYPMVLAHGQTFTRPVVPTPLDRRTDRPHKEMFADMLRYADRLVGQVVERVEAVGLRERTLIFVASDNGTESQMSARRNGREVKGGLYSMTEAGLDVTFIVNAPALVPPGRVASLMDFSDIYPTIVELAGARPPAGVKLDGHSLAALVRGRSSTSPRQWIFDQNHTRRVVRDARYKLFSTGEFYDLQADPDERHDLGTTSPAARAGLQSVLDGLPADTRLPFEPLSQAAFKLHAQR